MFRSLTFIQTCKRCIRSVAIFAGLFISIGTAGTAEAQVAAGQAARAIPTSPLMDQLQSDLYIGKTASAASVATDRLAAVPDDDQARFALGAIQFLQAVENLGQAFHRFGLRSTYEDRTGLSALPILRLPVPENPSPDRLTYEALRAVLDTFVRDLQTAEKTLSEIDGDPIDLPLNIGLIRLDLNGDGRGSDDEALWRIFRIVANANWLDEAEAEKLLVGFDRSDVPWLRAYCHLLIAIAEFPLAHDWHEAFEATFHGLFPSAGLPLSDILDDQYEFGGVADAIAFLHLTHWPVIEPTRMHEVLGHLEAMVQLSRENWTGILAEADDRSEWVPNPQQTGVFPELRVSQQQVEGWQEFLDEFQAILEGNKLIPHWRFDQGINLRRFFLEPTTFDVVLLIQGSAAVPYLEDGEFTDEDRWTQIMQLFAGDFFRYFIWFN